MIEKRYFHGAAGLLESFHCGRKGKKILILANGYGVLEYAKVLVESFAAYNYDVSALNFRGQGASEGELSVDGAASDIRDFILNFSDGEKVTILAHCTGVFPLLSDLITASGIWDEIEQVILYAYMANIEQYYDHFRGKAKKYNVRFDSEFLIPDLSPQSYSKIQSPWQVLHPLTHKNLSRASLVQLRELNQVASPDSIETPDCAYAISNAPQRERIQYFVDNYFVPLTKKY